MLTYRHYSSPDNNDDDGDDDNDYGNEERSGLNWVTIVLLCLVTILSFVLSYRSCNG